MILEKEKRVFTLCYGLYTGNVIQNYKILSKNSYSFSRDFIKNLYILNVKITSLHSW